MKKHRNILVVTYWPLTNALISTYTLPYLRIIRKKLPKDSLIWLFTLSPEKERNFPVFKTTQESLQQEGIISLDHFYRPFGWRMAFQFPVIFARLCWLIISKKITHIHAWCTPGGALGWLLSMITGKPLIVDSFEPHAETMVETGNWTRSSFSFKLLIWMEKQQLKRAKELICAAPGMMNYAGKTYGIFREEKFVKPACVDLDAFMPSIKRDRKELEQVDASDILCVYAGKFGGIYLDRETFDFFAEAQHYWPGRFKVLLLTSHSAGEVADFCAISGVDPTAVIKRFVSHTEVPYYLSMGDFAICPVKPIPTKRYCSPIKNGEYWALGLPVVITPDISIDSEIISRHRAGAVIDQLNTEGYRKALSEIDQLLKEPDHVLRIRQLAVQYRNFEIAELIYQSIYGKS